MKSAITLAAMALSCHAFAGSYTGSNFNKVWEQVASDSYAKPYNKVSFRSLQSFVVNKIKRSANRTLSDRSDLLPQFDKLAHPNGTCLKGTWKINKENPYGGYFKNGSEAQIIARASVALSKTTRGNHRGFGLAGKLFATDNPDSTEKFKTANFFLVDDLGGTKAPNYTGVGMTNEPKASVTTAVLLKAAYAAKLAFTFGKADSNPGVRQLYEVSELGESQTATVRTPKWMMVKAAPGQTVDEKDFRDELKIKNYNGELVFEIFVASREEKKQKNWKKIGKITFVESVISNSCDHKLHFHHPKWKSDLRH